MLEKKRLLGAFTLSDFCRLMVHDGIGCWSCALQCNYDPSVDTFGGNGEGHSIFTVLLPIMVKYNNKS